MTTPTIALEPLIKELHVEGFRSLKNVTWTPGKLNVVIGPNGSGKSNLLRVLEMIKMAADGRLSTFVRSAGGIESLLWDGEADQIALVLRTPTVREEGDDNRNWAFFELTVARRGRTGDYQIEEEKLVGNYGFSGPSGTLVPVPLLLRKGSDVQLFQTRGEPLSLAADIEPTVGETVLSDAKGAFFAGHPVSRYRANFSSWFVSHGIRTDQDAPLRAPALASYEQWVEPDGENLIAVLHSLYEEKQPFKANVDMAMRAAFGEDFDRLVFPPAADRHVKLGIRWKSLKRVQSAAEMSDGTLRFLFLLAVLAHPAPPFLIAIDEPETGLHPAMLPIIAEYAAEAAQQSQVIFTTHSPQMLDAFRSPFPTTTVAILEQGQTALKTLDGEALERWLAEYSLGRLYTSGELDDLAAETR